MEIRETTEEEQTGMEYLNELREEGTVNMFGARPYLQEHLSEEGYPTSKEESGAILNLWMANYNEEGRYDTVKA